MESLLERLKYSYCEKRYVKKIMDAYHFTTTTWGTKLNLSDVTIPPKAYSDQAMQQILSFIKDYLLTKGIENIALRCSVVCIELHNILKENFMVDSIVTSGYLKINKKNYFYADRSAIVSQFGKNGIKLKHHVWLIIGEYIIDPTLMSSLYIANPNFFSEETLERNAVIFYKYKYSKIKIENENYEHKPLFLGKQFYDYTKYGYTEYTIAQNH